MAYLFYTQIQDGGLYKVFGFDPASGWAYLLSPGPAELSGYALEGIDRLADGKTYMGLRCDAPNFGRVKYHLGSAWAEQTTGVAIGDQTHFTAMRAFAGGHFYFMNHTWSSGGNSNLYYWNGTTLVSLGVVSTNIQRMAFMDGVSQNLLYMCGWRPSANCLYRWNGTSIEHIGDSGGPGGGMFGGVGAIGNDIYLLAFSEDFSYWGTQCCKLKKGTWGGAWSTVRDFTTTYGQGNSQLNAVAIDRSNNNIWVLLRRSSDGHVFACRYNGSTWTDYDLYSLLGAMQPNQPRGIAAMGGKCMVTSNPGTGATTRTCYFNGTSWSVESLPGTTDGNYPIGVSAEPFVGYSPCDIPSTTSRLLNLFDTGTTMRSHPGNGTITYPGFYARLTAPNSANCQFYIGDGAGRPPLLYERAGALIQEAAPPQPVVFETRLAAFSGTTNLRIAGLALFTTPYTDVNVPWYSYQFGWYKYDGKLHVWLDYPTTEIEIFTAVTVADPAVTPHRYRIYWNPYNRPLYIPELNLTLNTDQLCFAYSLNECTTWTSLGVRTRDFGFNNVYTGIYVRKWETSAVNAVADFDYFSVRQYVETQQVLIPKVGQDNPEALGFEDQAELLTESGPPRFDLGGIGGDVVIPHPTPLAYEDGGKLLSDGDHPRFDISEILEPPVLPSETVAFEEGVFVQLDNTDYIKGKLDGDGKELAGGTSIRHVLFYDSTLEPWHTHGAGFYGAGRDGKLYYNGVECGPGPFSAGGTPALNRTAWSGPDGYLDYSGVANAAALSYPTAGTVRMAPVSTVTQIATVNRWFLTGDFDVQIDYAIVSAGSGPSNGGIALEAWIDGNNRCGVRRQMFGGNYYNAYCLNNGSWGTNYTVATSDTSGKLRVVRIGAVLSMYYWNGSAWVQIGSSYTMTYNRPMWLNVGGWFNTIPISTVYDVSGFQINSGATTNLIGWAREVAGTYRGSKVDFPEHAVILSSGNSLDIIDADTDKLWMSFRGSANQLIGGDANYYVPQVVFKDGTLLLCYRTFDTYGTADGYGYWIDFNLDFARCHRGPTYNDAGFIANVELTTGVWPRDSANGCIAWRNSSRSAFAAHFDNWQFQNNRANWADLLHDGGFQYRLIANNGGVYLAKWERWKFEGSGNAHLNTPDYGTSTQTVAMRWAEFRPTSRDILCHNRTKFWITHYAAWNLVLSGGGGSWLEDHEYTLAGTVDALTEGALAQDNMTFDDTAGLLFYARNEGVFVMDLATGVSTLLYGKVGSGATHEILGEYATISSVKFATDGATPVLLVGMARPDRIWAVNRITHVVYWRGFQDDAHQPLSMAVRA